MIDSESGKSVGTANKSVTFDQKHIFSQNHYSTFVLPVKSISSQNLLVDLPKKPIQMRGLPREIIFNEVRNRIFKADV